MAELLRGPWGSTPVVQSAPVPTDQWWRRADDGTLWVRCGYRSSQEPPRWQRAPVPMADLDWPLPDRSPNRDRITLALDGRGLDGPEVDEALQGWALDDYRRCIDLYTNAGVDLTTETTVGLGSVCRRQSDTEIYDICAALAAEGIRLHGFGVKTAGLRRYGRHLGSADSMAWSYNARYRPALPGHSHRSCANCITWALRWRDRVLRALDVQQLALWDAS